MEKILAKKSLLEWAKRLHSYDVYAPVLRDDIWNYELVHDPAEIDLCFLQTVLPPKKIIFPQREIFFEFATAGGKNPQIQEVLPEPRPAVVFGVRPCDARSFPLLDEVFDGNFRDVYYYGRRNQTVLVGVSCTPPPSSDCFCLSVDGSPHSTEGLDILLTDVGDDYFVETITEKGDRLLDGVEDLFVEPTTADRRAAKKIKLESEREIVRTVKNIKDIPPKIKRLFDSPFWDEESKRCLKCGICTYLCPTCHCFDMNDEVASVYPLKGKRVRSWDTCQFPDFTMHSSGHNPRPDKASRLRQRIFHKFHYFVENHHRFLCTGCGRCISKCPVGIDLIDILQKVETHG